MSSRAGHRYDMALYGALNGRVDRIGMPASFPDDESTFLAALDGIDLFHMHWPELLLEPRIELHARLIAHLQDRGVRIVWTQHNLLPHTDKNDWPAIYQLWADAAMGIIHHSQWGQHLATGFRAYRPNAVHAVIRHGHWGEISVNEQHLDRETLAQPYKTDPARTHLGIVGAPRAAKDIGLVIEAFRACDRDDLDLAIFSRGENERIARHPRIYARSYSMTPRSNYNQRLAYIDVLVLPFRDDGSMLTTGLIGDVIGVAKPAIISDWPFLTETFGDTALCYGNDVAGLTQVFADLDVATLDQQADALRALQPVFAWERSADATLELFETMLG